MAHEYGWTIEYIENLTCSRVKRILKTIEKRQKDEEYMIRVHAGIEAMAIVNALGASFNGDNVTLEELVGKPLEEQEVQPISANTEIIEEWKSEAKKAGLKTGDN